MNYLILKPQTITHLIILYHFSLICFGVFIALIAVLIYTIAMR